MLYISHVLEVVEQVCDRVVILANGKVIADGSPRDLTQMTSQPTLERVFAQMVQQIDTAEVVEHLVSVMQNA